MSFFRRLDRKRHNRDFLLFWLSLAALAAIIYIFFFAPVKKITAVTTMPPASSVSDNLPQATGPMPLRADAPVILPACRAWISHNETDVPSQSMPSFFPHEKIHLHVTFPELPAGTARVNVNWVSPAGKHSNSAEQVIRQAQTGPAATRFWLSFAPNGAVTALFTGKDYKRQVYGQWQAQVFFNGEPLLTLPFLIQE